MKLKHQPPLKISGGGHQIFRSLTAEGAEEKVLKGKNLCDLCASVVKLFDYSLVAVLPGIEWRAIR